MKYLNMNKKYPFMVATLVATLLVLCLSSIGCSRPTYTYLVPEQVQGDWKTASLEEVGISRIQIEQAMNSLLRMDNNPLHCILIVKDNKLVLEEYFPGEDISIESGLHFEQKDFDQNTLHCLASASKSVTSILLGIAIDQGNIASIKQKLFSFFPDYEEFANTEKNLITIYHLLTMSSGIPWNESYSYDDPRNDLAQMIQEEDPLGYVLEKSLVAEPGETFIYNSGTTNVLGEIVRRTTGYSLKDYAEKYLFTPLNITAYSWTSFPNAEQDIVVASSLLYLKPRDMAKIGQLYLQGGVWNGKQIVSENWISESTDKGIEVPMDKEVINDFNTSYGYQWWRGTFSNGRINTYYAAGYGGQFIFVLPEENMVIVFTAGQYDGRYEGFVSLINDGFIPATGNHE